MKRVLLTGMSGTGKSSVIEERAARGESTKELRLEMQRGFRWTFSALLSILALVLGIIARLAGAF